MVIDRAVNYLDTGELLVRFHFQMRSVLVQRFQIEKFDLKREEILPTTGDNTKAASSTERSGLQSDAPALIYFCPFL